MKKTKCKYCNEEITCNDIESLGKKLIDHYQVCPKLAERKEQDII